MILALLLALQWDLYVLDPTVDRLEAVAFERAPVILPCSDPDEGDCIVAYLETWREVQALPVTAIGASWTAPELPSKGVAYYYVVAGRPDMCFSDGQH